MSLIELALFHILQCIFPVSVDISTSDIWAKNYPTMVATKG